jgi:hypothetical protein
MPNKTSKANNKNTNNNFSHLYVVVVGVFHLRVRIGKRKLHAPRRYSAKLLACFGNNTRRRDASLVAQPFGRCTQHCVGVGPRARIEVKGVTPMHKKIEPGWKQAGRALHTPFSGTI